MLTITIWIGVELKLSEWRGCKAKNGGAFAYIAGKEGGVQVRQGCRDRRVMQTGSDVISQVCAEVINHGG
jgi:hypothetical protein